MSTHEETNLKVKVIPKASHNQIVGWENDELKIRLNAIPEKGAANELLIVYLAKTLGIPKSSILLVSGGASRHKRLKLKGISKSTLDQLLSKFLDAKNKKTC